MFFGLHAYCPQGLYYMVSVKLHHYYWNLTTLAVFMLFAKNSSIALVCMMLLLHLCIRKWLRYRSQIQVSKSYKRQNKTSIRVYAVKSDDDPKAWILNLEKTNKTSIRVYAVKSDDDPKALNPKPREDQQNQYPGLCRKKRWWSKSLES
jgi:hypothetical protein